MIEIHRSSCSVEYSICSGVKRAARTTSLSRSVAVGADLADGAKDGLDHDRRQAHRRLVKGKQDRSCHQRAADCQHLLLAAAQGAGELAPPFGQNGEETEGARLPIGKKPLEVAAA